MPGPRKNKDRGIPTNTYAGRPNKPQAKPIASGDKPTFVQKGTPSLPTSDNKCGGIPIAIEYLQDGSVPIFWGDNQIMRQSDQRYLPPSKMTSDSTMAIPEVVRFIYSGLPNPTTGIGGCLPPTTSPPPPPPPPPPGTIVGNLVIEVDAAGPLVVASDGTNIGVPPSTIDGTSGVVVGNTGTGVAITLGSGSGSSLVLQAIGPYYTVSDYSFAFSETSGVYTWTGLNPITATVTLYFVTPSNSVISATGPLAAWIWNSSISGPAPSSLAPAINSLISTLGGRVTQPVSNLYVLGGPGNMTYLQYIGQVLLTWH